jgi:hypothetical protein
MFEPGPVTTTGIAGARGVHRGDSGAGEAKDGDEVRDACRIPMTMQIRPAMSIIFT